MSWGIVAGAAGAIGGALIGSKGSKDAANIAAGGSEKEIAFNRESRDLARADQAPYLEAGYEALDALRSLTGLGGPRGSATQPNTSSRNFGMTSPGAGVVDNVGTLLWDDTGYGAGGRQSSYRHPGVPNPVHRYAGGPTEPDTVYNVSEIAPENIYSKGRMTRPQRPATIDGETGYVEPNIKGRAEGGYVDRNPVFDVMGRGDTPSPHMGYEPPTINTNPANSTAINPRTGYPNENPGGVEGGYNFQTDPGYQFRFSEGMRALDRGAAAKGGLLSGGYGRKAIRYGQDYASGEYTNVYNRIANIAGLGQTSAQNSGQAALYAGANMGTAAAQGDYARASGYQAAGNTWANAGNQIAQLPWGNVFNQNEAP